MELVKHKDHKIAKSNSNGSGTRALAAEPAAAVAVLVAPSESQMVSPYTHASAKLLVKRRTLLVLALFEPQLDGFIKSLRITVTTI